MLSVSVSSYAGVAAIAVPFHGNDLGVAQIVSRETQTDIVGDRVAATDSIRRFYSLATVATRLLVVEINRPNCNWRL